MTSPNIEAWGAARLDELTELVAVALPGEELHAEELAGVAFHPGAVVLAEPAGRGAVVAARSGTGPGPEVGEGAAVVLLVVHPDARRTGVGRRLLEAAETWAGEQGARHLELGGGGPFYLWAGVDERWEPMRALAVGAGYEEIEESRTDMELSTAFRAPTPDGVVVRRVRRPRDVDAVARLCADHWPRWLDELTRALGHGTCHAAFTASPDDPDGEGGAAVAFGCHSVNRGGWIGPMATRPDHERRGVGHAVLDRICRDLTFAELDTAVVSWVGPEGFYQRAGAVVSRRYRVLTKAL